MAVILVTGMLSKDVIDGQTADTIQTTLYLPTAIALIAFSILSVKLEIEKPKYRHVQKSREIVNVLLFTSGAILFFGMVYMKYFI